MNIIDDDENIDDDEMNETDPMKSFHHSDIMMPEILYGQTKEQVLDMEKYKT